MDLNERLFRLLKAVTHDTADSFLRMFEFGSEALDEKLKEWEKKHGLNDDEDSYDRRFNRENRTEETSSYGNYSRTGSSNEKKDPFPAQLVQDLELFGLKPPVTLEQVKKARNSEIKKFHPDKFQNDPEKADTAKQILQIYNSAFERIRASLKE